VPHREGGVFPEAVADLDIEVVYHPLAVRLGALRPESDFELVVEARRRAMEFLALASPCAERYRAAFGASLGQA
jgi:hypothetical protein